MNNVYNTKEIYNIRGDMCYDNKIMMVTAPSEGTLDEVITKNIAGLDRNINLQKQTLLQKLRKRLRRRILVDTLIFVIVALLVCLVEFGIIPNTKLGFTCKDPKLSYPFKGDTVSVTTLLISAYFGPILIITLVEVLKEHSFKKVRLGIVWNYYRECLIGATFVLLITEVIKVIVGEPRPHFLDSCEPDVKCKEGAFIVEYNCTNTRLSNFFLSDITRSFPSGHTSVSLFIALYCSYLIQIRIPSKSVSTLTKPFLIAVCLTWCLLCSLSRITDRRHHWWDVLGGAFLGLCGALYTLSLLHSKETKEKNRLSRTSTSMTIMSEKSKDTPSVVI
ncbi:putative phosphatidate phosphatase isoform X3 [Tribolium castaneum]|uniref:putative phosphatidate phosphatase isoform X3 n=1 Tax=Tribolium castaneum TaxID=7070 RepID=UPI0030FE8C62